jgi:hypothetical protein
MEKLKNNKKQLLFIAVAFVLGVFWVFAIRFVTLEKEEVHYHANFAVFTEGERLLFDNFTFYEEVAACGGNGVDSPKIRAHMHDNINHVVHVHDNGVTWGHFFANLGFANGDTVFRTNTDLFVEDEDTKITFILNGKEVSSTANVTIDNEDVLLVSIGESSKSELNEQYEQITKDAAVYNEQDDPSACSGGEPLTITERLKATFRINE